MSKQTRPLSGRVAAITGGARGIGRATAEALVRQGARVALGDLDAQLAEQTAAELGGGTIGLPLDVADRASFTDFFESVERRLGPVDVLVNNAGIMPLGPFSAEGDEVAQRLVDINLHGVIVGTKLALERMLPRGSGHVVNIASQAGKAGFAGAATYCATKHAVVGLTASLADELDGTGIDVSCVMPAIVRTELTTGVASPRLVKPVQPQDVADAIVEVLQRPRLNVHVPKVAAITSYVALLPRAAQRQVQRLLRAEQLMLHADAAARAAYDARIAGTAAERETVAS
jgi:NAD(P)-dependent dehydrogenase (short-subunit alcohol dehydrogenase family)